MKINLDLLSEKPKTSVVEVIKPSLACDLRVVILTEHPQSESSSKPLSGSWESSVNCDLKEAGLLLNQCYQASVLDFYPTKEHFKIVRKKARINFEHPRVRESLHRVEQFLLEVKPHVIIGLGSEVVQYLKPESQSIDSERGAPFWINHFNCFALCTYTPTRIFQQYALRPLVLADLQKAIRLARSGWREPQYKIDFLPSFATACTMLRRFREKKAYLSVDIETFGDLTISCIGIAYNSKAAIVIPFFREHRKPYWQPAEEREIWRLLADVLENCPLVGHNAVHFDHYGLAVKYNILANFVDDTMFAHWEKFCELEKSLAFISSLYTDNPYWKSVLRLARSGKSEYWREYEYCGKDCIITMQCAQAIAKDLTASPNLLKHYRFNVRISRAFQYMSVQGFKLDKELHASRLDELEREACVQAEIFQEQSSLKMSDILKDSKSLTAKEKRLFNLRSSKKVQNWLYDQLNLPPQTKLVKNEFGDMESKETSDYLALLYLARVHPEYPAIETAGRLRRLLKRISTLRSYKYDSKGIMRWTFNVVGTVTGRASGYKPLDGIGIQPQNVDRKDRDLCLPLDGFLWWKADLEGADSWTVAAQLASLGHHRMMDDLKAGLKPAARLAIAECARQPELLFAPAVEVLAHKHLLKTPHGQIVYRVNKAVSHGTNYGMKKKTMHNNIFKQSDGDIYVEPDECDEKQKQLLQIYGIGDLHSFMESLMLRDGVLTSGVGTKRQFFGRKDSAMLRGMLSHLPQFYTGFTTNVVISRLYYGKQNRKGGKLIHHPACQVHDETNNYFREDDLDDAIRVFREVCHVPLELWGQFYEIPWEAGYGVSWGNAKNEVHL